MAPSVKTPGRSFTDDWVTTSWPTGPASDGTGVPSWTGVISGPEGSGVAVGVEVGSGAVVVAGVADGASGEDVLTATGAHAAITSASDATATSVRCMPQRCTPEEAVGRPAPANLSRHDTYAGHRGYANHVWRPTV